MHFLIIPSNYLPTIIIEPPPPPPPGAREPKKKKWPYSQNQFTLLNALKLILYGFLGTLYSQGLFCLFFSSLSFFICPWLRRLNYSQLRYLTAMLRMSVITPIIITCSVSWCRIVYFICDTVNFFELPITRPRSAFALIDPITIFLVIWCLVAYY